MPKKLKLMVCVDRSEHSRVAVRYACKEADRLGFKVEMVHVINPSEYNTLFVGGDMLREEKRAEAEALLKEIIKSTKDLSKVKPSYQIREGFLSDEVVKAIAEDDNVNMLILGKAPETSNKKDFIAQLSAELVSKIMVPMLIVPGNLTDLQIEELT